MPVMCQSNDKCDSYEPINDNGINSGPIEYFLEENKEQTMIFD